LTVLDFANHTTVAPDLYFPEALRWRDGALWFSDVFGHTVSRLDGAGIEVVVRVPGMPSGLGWLPDGTLLVVSMEQKSILSVIPGGEPAVYADLSDVCPQLANDMVVDGAGRAYVGNYGYDVDAGAAIEATHLVRVDPDRSIHVEAPEVIFPNGCVLIDDERTLVVAETFADRVTALTIEADGSLSDPRTIAELPPGSGPDGLTVESSGRIWVPCAYGGRAVAITPDGRIDDEVLIPGVTVTCCAIGADDETLFIALAPLDEAEAAAHPTGRIVSLEL
jgi:sugar lactone lactonase YvrE